MFDGRDPLYVQIADQIRADVLSGALEAEEQVMSTTQYATTFRINPATALKGVTTLVDEGALYKKRGIGMFVAEGAQARLVADRRERFTEEYVRPLLAEAEKLGIASEQVAEMIKKEGTR